MIARHSRGDLIDVDVSLSRWPPHRLPGGEPAELVAKLRGHRVLPPTLWADEEKIHEQQYRLPVAVRRQTISRLFKPQ